jgi:hypothetical protein
VPNKIKTNPETPIVFQPSNNPFPSGAGMPNGVIVDFRPAGTANAAGRISAEYDLGPGPRTTLFEWRGNATFGSGVTVGTSVDAYISTSNSVFKDGHLPTTEGPVVYAEKRRNLQFCGSMVADTPVNNPLEPGNAAGLVEIFGRYISLLWWNNTNAPLGTGNCFILTPVPDEVQ